MGASGMGVDANGKPIKRQAPNNNNNNGNNKKGKNNNQKNGNNNNKNNRNNQGNRGGDNRNRHIQPAMPMIPPFGPMGGPMRGPMGPGPFMGVPPVGNFFNANQNRRSGGGGGGKNNGNRNGAQQPGYNGPSANNVGQGAVGGSVNPFGPSEPSMDVPGFGKNSNIHELFGKMIWRKMEQIQDQALVDQLQNRIMNLIHDALAGQNEQKQQQQQQQQQGFNQGGVPPFGAANNQKVSAFGGNAVSGFQRF
uniref:Uncharacterized protein n=1 Tax=Caenorhabditis japonica TaxID=281687 RepID=A0A8R1HYE2_CAEJA